MTWTPERDEIALRLYQHGLTPTKIGEHIDKSQKAVSRRLLRLGVVMERKDLWTADQLNTLRQNWGNGMPAREIGLMIGKSKNAVIARAGRDGLKSKKHDPNLGRAHRNGAKPTIAPQGKRNITNRAAGCQYLTGEPRERNFCGVECRPDSSYCDEHHERCWIDPRKYQSEAA